MTQIDTSGLEKTGTLISGGGLAAIFDGSLNTTAWAQSKSGKVWVRLNTPSRIDRIEVVSPLNGFDCSGSTTPVTLVLRADVGDVEPALNSGNLKSFINFTDINARTTRVLDCPDKDTLFSWVGVSMATGIWCGLAELRIYAVAEPVLIPDLPPVIVPGTLEERVYALEQRLSRPLIWHGNSGKHSEMIPHAPITKQPYSFQVVYSVALPDVYVGDVIQAFGILEVTNDTNAKSNSPALDWVMGATYITIGSSPTDTNLSKRFAEANGRNVGRVTTHHDVHPNFGSLVVEENTSGLYVNMIAYAAHINAANQILDIEPGYGRLFVTVTRAAALN